MFATKDEYYLFIIKTTDFNPNIVKIRNKFNIIYRNNNKPENVSVLSHYKNNCKKKGIKFLIANNAKLAVDSKADGLYISAHNKDLGIAKPSNKNFIIIGSAHSYKEIKLKKNQGCKKIIFSRLFNTDHKHKKGFLGIVKFNLIANIYRFLVPLGGIKINNLNCLRIINSQSLAIFSEVKKKPTIISRLF